MKNLPYTAKLVWFKFGPAWTCQLDGKHVITIHHGDNELSWAAAMITAARLNISQSPAALARHHQQSVAVMANNPA